MTERSTGSDHGAPITPGPRLPEQVGPTVPPAAGVPFLPPTVREPAEPVEPPPFDARAMVAAQKRGVDHPAYGQLPTATPENVAAAQALREVARRKRKRNQRLGWIVALALLGVVGTAGLLAYRAYQHEQDQNAAERIARREAEAAAAEDPAADTVDTTTVDGGPVALTPLGEQAEVLGALDVVDDVPAPSAGGLVDVIDDAEAAVGALGQGADGGGQAGTTPLTLDILLPDVAVQHAERLTDADGLERYVVDAAGFEAADPAAYRTFVDALRAQPQLDTGAAALDVLPAVDAGEIAVAVRRDGDRLGRVVVVSIDPDLRVAVAP